MFQVNNKDTRTTASLIFTPFSSVSIVDFEQGKCLLVSGVKKSQPNKFR